MSLRRACCVVVTCAMLFNPLELHAQKANPAFGEVLDVRVTNVDVVATDSSGKPVVGLTQGDFEIYEDGKRQEISNFFEMSMKAAAGTDAGQPAASSRPGGAASNRKYIFYVDNGTLSLKNRNDIFTGISEFLSTNLTPGDQVMIVNWSGSTLHVRQPWTSDRTTIDATLKTLSGELGAAGQLQAEKQRTMRTLRQYESVSHSSGGIMVTYAMVESAVRSYAESARHDITLSVNALTKLLASLSGVEGKKVLVMATETLPTQAAAEVFAVFQNLRTRATLAPPPPEPSTEAGSSRSPNPFGAGIADGSRTATPVGDLGKYNVTPMIEALARTANATGVTVYAINPKGTDNNPSGKADQQTVTESNVDFADASQTLDGINLLTRQTGGAAAIGAPASVALARLTQDLGSYYSIGYRSRPGKSPDRKVEVRAKRAGVSVRYRNSIYYRSLQTEMADHVIANHLQTELPNDMGIALQTDAVTTDGGRKLLPMRVVIPADSLTLLPDAEGNLTGGFSVFTSTGSGDGAASGVDMQSQQIKWPAAQASQMKGRRIGFAVQVPMDKNPKQISVGVVDHVSQTQGFATIKIAAN